ncbi:MAG: glycoside hydrolase family 31 protein [Saprospiraceae bacterium]
MQENDETSPALPPEPPVPVPPSEIDYAGADVSTRYDDIYQVVTADEIATVRWREGAYEFVCRNGIALRLQFVTAGVVRLRYSPDGLFARDHSYAIDPAFQPEKVTITLDETDSEYLLNSESLQIVILKQGMRIRFYDQSDRALCEDAGGFSAKRTIMRGWCELRMSKKCHRKEAFYGLGDKSCSANLHGKKFELWCTDAYAYGRETDPLYRAIPFYYSFNLGIAYGIFLDNSFKTHFDFNSADSETTEFWAEGGELNYYFISGPAPDEVSRAYARLTGRFELPPLWALGYHQCRWSYYPHGRVRRLAHTFREKSIPCDAIYLDIDYMDGFRCFTWDNNHFPDPKQLIDDLRDLGFATVCMIDPGIKEDPGYEIYKEGIENEYFVKTADGDVAKGPVWPGFCAFPDFTDERVRSWWGSLYDKLYVQDGIAGFWNDMNEPAVFHVNHKTLPDQVMHHFDGNPASHRKGHNVYGMLMTRASFEGLRRLKPGKRPFLLTRASFSGGQRYGAVWTGDNVSSWEHLLIANIQCQRLSVSGFSFCGTDIGGFAGELDPELYVRWLQLAVFHPLMRMHSMGGHQAGDTAITDEAQLTDPSLHTFDREPWSFGDKITDLAKKAIELRYALLPCLYTAFRKHAQDGTPVIRHAAFADPADPKLIDQERDFLFGDHIWVSPVVQAKQQRQMVYLPQGNWYYFWTGQAANGEMFINLMPDQLPFFVREGAVLPVYPVRQWTGERPVDELTLYVYYKNGNETSHLYEDEGEGYAYQEGQYSHKTFETRGQNGNFSLSQQKSGDWEPTYKTVKIYLVGFPAFVRSCLLDGEEIPIKEIRLRDRSLYTLTAAAGFNTVEWHA